MNRLEQTVRGQEWDLKGVRTLICWNVSVGGMDGAYGALYSIPCQLNTNNLNIKIYDKDNNEHVGGTAVNVGNPHIIFFVKDCFEYDLKILGPKIENNELFPERTNVTFAEINDRNNITVNVWERGAGLTKACGTAACATAVAAMIKKLTENDINIKFKEGTLNLKVDKDLNIFMRGPVSDIKYTRLEI